MAGTAMPWLLRDWSGTAGDFHSLDLPGERAVWVCRPVAPVLVLGSGQPAVDVDHEAARAAGVEVVRRRSGGGVVWVHPDDTLWVDLTIGRDDPLWREDVSSSMLWLGESLVEAVAALGLTGTTVHRGPFDPGPWGRTVCFAGAAPGEVMRGDAKVAGLSQRRGRRGARFQCLVHRRWHPDAWVGFLRDPAAREAARRLPIAEVEASADALAGALWATVGARWGKEGQKVD